jgi:hypothetical protein
MTFDWGTYHPSIVEILIVVETFAFVCLGMLLFAKVLPLIPLFDIKEGMVNRRLIKVGRRVIPATIREGLPQSKVIWVRLTRLERVLVMAKRSVLGLYSEEDSAADALDNLREAGFDEGEYEILTGVP